MARMESLGAALLKSDTPIAHRFWYQGLLPKELELDGQGPLYEQLARALKRAILDGRFAPGKRLPATRSLAKTLGLSRNTVLGAYELLCTEALATAHGRSGTRVVFDAQTTAAHRTTRTITAPSRYVSRVRNLPPTTLGAKKPSRRLDLHYGEPLLNARLFHSWRRKLAAAALQAGPRYPESSGFRPLRRAICEHVARRRGIICTEDDILIVGGTQQAVTLTARVVLDEGDLVVSEDPYYQHTVQTLIAHGARMAFIGTDENGLLTSELNGRGARLIYVTPSHQFPAGSVLSLERRLELLEIASSEGSWILEDDYDSEFHYHGRPLPALRSLDLGDRVIYVGSFSKTLFPSVRLGYIVCPVALRADLCAAKRLDDLGSPAIEQAALAAFIHSGQFARHLRASVTELRHRRDALVEGLRRHAGDRVVIRGAQGGVHLVLWFPGLRFPQLDRLIEFAAERDLGIYPIHTSYHTAPPWPGLLVGYASLTPTALRTAAALLGECLDRLAKE
jgi:GntR family transcriptional regulator / MocR family aminotransferase